MEASVKLDQGTAPDAVFYKCISRSNRPRLTDGLNEGGGFADESGIGRWEDPKVAAIRRKSRKNKNGNDQPAR